MSKILVRRTTLLISVIQERILELSAHNPVPDPNVLINLKNYLLELQNLKLYLLLYEQADHTPEIIEKFSGRIDQIKEELEKVINPNERTIE
jgi:hypothetical protein